MKSVMDTSFTAGRFFKRCLLSLTTSLVIVSAATTSNVVSQIGDGQIQVAASTTSSLSSRPTVDLGYAIHQASLSISNQSNAYYNFSNIRYAAPPVGDLRWAATAPPLNNRSAGIQDGSYGKICPQAFAGWQLGNLSLVQGAENENEDCLFLDVVVPKIITERRDKSKLVPVVVWIHGGGYTLGSKYAAGSPTGLLDQSLDTTSGGEIWVGINYRLGAFGWLNGPNFTNAEGTPNAGLYDQRTALYWVQHHIHLFGGNPNNVTVMGESAGGGSIMHQITAYGGVKAPFQQAIMQSPAFFPIPLKNQSNAAFRKFLTAAGVSNVTQLRKLNSTFLQAANKIAQSGAFFGSFTFGPAPDSHFVPDLPGKLLLSGHFDKSLKVIAAHNSNEAGRYTDPAATASANFTSVMRLYFPEITTGNLSYITDTLYPADYTGKYIYTTPFLRLDRAISDFTFDCSTLYLAHAYRNQTYNYLFSVSPGNHTQDVPYTYFNGPISTVRNNTVAIQMQRYLTGFIEKGDPNRPNLGSWPVFGSRGVSRNFNLTEISNLADVEVSAARCAWWQKALYGDDY